MKEIAPWWEVLGVSQNATIEEIRQAHSTLRHKLNASNASSSDQHILIGAYREACRQFDARILDFKPKHI